MSKLNIKEYSATKRRDFKYLQWKRDGFTLTVKCVDGVITCTTRKPLDITEELSELYWFKKLQETTKGKTVTFIGELWFPGEKASYVSTAIKERNPGLTFEVFAVEQFEVGASFELLQGFVREFGVKFIPFEPYREDKVTDDLVPYTEGYVLSDGMLKNMHKYKPVRTIDLIVRSFKHGKGKYKGTVGALVCGVYSGPVVASCSGMDDDERLYLKMNKKDVLGKVVEIAYQYVGKQGKLRHPRFVRFRTDKNPEECTLDQDPELAKIWEEKE